MEVGGGAGGGILCREGSKREGVGRAHCMVEEGRGEYKDKWSLGGAGWRGRGKIQCRKRSM